MATVSITARNQTRSLSLAHVTQEFDVKQAQSGGLCQYWPQGRSALEILMGTASPWLKVAIGLVIAAGDAACPMGSG
jgi:hypothetical protein